MPKNKSILYTAEARIDGVTRAGILIILPDNKKEFAFEDDQAVLHDLKGAALHGEHGVHNIRITGRLLP